jgi:hypothetical protein
MVMGLLCRISGHRWQHRRNPDGEDYRTCRRCGKDDDYSGVESVFRAAWWT